MIRLKRTRIRTINKRLDPMGIIIKKKLILKMGKKGGGRRKDGEYSKLFLDPLPLSFPFSFY